MIRCSWAAYYDHPWASSDVILAIRSDLAAAERGLRQGEVPLLWSIPANYPERLRESLRTQPLREKEMP